MNAVRHSLVRGYSLIELMIAILISMIILSAIGYVFMTARSTQRQLTQIGRTQESARFVLERVSREIRHAGYIGCRKLGYDSQLSVSTMADPVPDSASGPVILNPYLALRVFNASDSADWEIGLPNNFNKPASAVPDRPVVEVRHAAENAMTVKSDASSGDLTLQLTGNAEGVFKADSLAVLATCSISPPSGQIVRIASVSGNTLTLDPADKVRFKTGQDAQIAPLKIVQYFVGTSTANAENKSVSTLMQREMHSNGKSMLSSQPLFDHVTDFDLLLGLNAPNSEGKKDGIISNRSGKWSAETDKYFPTKDVAFDSSTTKTDDATNRTALVSVELVLDVESQKSGVATDGGRLKNTFSTVVARRNRQQQIN